MKRFVLTLASLVVATGLGAAGCGKATSPSPLAPSAASSAATGSGSASSRVQIAGRISSISQPSRSFVVSATTVVVPSSASLSSGSGQLEFKDLQVEMDVQISGTMQGATMTADEVHVDDHGNDPQPQPQPGNEGETEFSGLVASVGGSCPSLTLSVASKTVKTGAATSFLKAACGDIKSGATVEVKGTVMADGSVSATRVQVDDDGAMEPEPGDQGETEFTGAVSSVGGSCPALSLSVAGRSVTSNASTEFKDGGCGDVRTGVMLEVKGKADSASKVAASRLKFEK
jgi:hypothetical protein